MQIEARPPSWKILLAFGIIYFVWGSTFLAIRIGVHEVPPFLLAALRFFTAGLVLYAWLRLKGTPAPSRREWVSASALGALIFLLDYGCLFWAEQRVPSGVTAVVLATIPVFIALLEIIFLRTQKLTVRLGLALAVGILGVAVLMNRSFSLGEAPIDRAGALALLVASATWSIATILTRRDSAPRVEGYECCRADGHRRSDAFRAGRGVTRVFRISCANGIPKRLVRSDLSDHRGFDCGLHRLRMVAAL